MLLQQGDDSELNMTPMIDIVFQLIIFFLLTLKFKTVDHRIESNLPNTQGLDPTPTFPPDLLKIKIKVFRRGLESTDDAEDDYTLLKIDNTQEFSLPRGWRGRAQESAARLREYDAVTGAVRALVQDKLAQYGEGAAKVRGEIVAPPPKGGAVPHGDVVQMLNVFLEAGITDVMLEGSAAPLDSKQRRAQPALD